MVSNRSSHSPTNKTKTRTKKRSRTESVSDDNSNYSQNSQKSNTNKDSKSSSSTTIKNNSAALNSNKNLHNHSPKNQNRQDRDNFRRQKAISSQSSKRSKTELINSNHSGLSRLYPSHNNNNNHNQISPKRTRSSSNSLVNFSHHHNHNNNNNNQHLRSTSTHNHPPPSVPKRSPSVASTGISIREIERKLSASKEEFQVNSKESLSFLPKLRPVSKSFKQENRPKLAFSNISPTHTDPEFLEVDNQQVEKQEKITQSHTLNAQASQLEEQEQENQKNQGNNEIIISKINNNVEAKNSNNTNQSERDKLENCLIVTEFSSTEPTNTSSQLQSQLQLQKLSAAQSLSVSNPTYQEIEVKKIYEGPDVQVKDTEQLNKLEKTLEETLNPTYIPSQILENTQTQSNSLSNSGPCFGAEVVDLSPKLENNRKNIGSGSPIYESVNNLVPDNNFDDNENDNDEDDDSKTALNRLNSLELLEHNRKENNVDQAKNELAEFKLRKVDKRDSGIEKFERQSSFNNDNSNNFNNNYNNNSNIRNQSLPSFSTNHNNYTNKMRDTSFSNPGFKNNPFLQNNQNFNNSLSKPVKVERDDPSLKSVKNKKSMFEAAMNGGDNNMNNNRNEVGSFGGGNRPFVKLKKTIFGGWNFVL